ncbi:hypothetical protein [uncultured Flavobacterium sp.]|uniref:hypothetical protein n=1 Tax=uncultured Flavobacterium sp. TaxID=165435 RepID=UPI0025E63C70|nr:hypothetical protein [uncultured Flavobacterium sp.]
MFKTISEEIFSFLTSLPEFNAVMKRNGKDYLWPMVAPIDTDLPLTTYVLGERTPETKDKSQIVATLAFWYGIESYDSCCEFTDVIANAIDKDYILVSSSIEYNPESNTFSGIINYKLI